MPSHGDATDAMLVESTADLGAPGTLFARAEWVIKAGHDLDLQPDLEERTFPVGNLALGYLHDFGAVAGLVPGVGVRAAFNVIGDDLAALYDTHTPFGAMVYVRVEPAAMDHGPGHGPGHGAHH
jgi:hypothetical protein